VLITGTRKGIGRFLVNHFIARGATVVGCSRGPVDIAAEQYTHHLVDVADEAQVKAMLSAIRKQHGRLDVVVNNAGVAAMNHVMLTPLATSERITRTNFQGTFLVCREAAKLMMKQRSGRIVNISTVAVPFQLDGEAVYAASKAAVETFTRIFAREVAEFGITCNVLALPPIETDLIRAVPREKIDAIISRLAIKRLGRFEDAANVIDFFIKPESNYVTGQTIYLGGV
jgi:3-oxoacyl-[acyl-carrier protein] reductase